MGHEGNPHPRLGCSTITFRHKPLEEALAQVRRIGFAEVDLGALPGVCSHVPSHLDNEAVATVAAVVGSSGLAVRSVNADIGDLNEPLSGRPQESREASFRQLISLAKAVGSRAIVLPCGRQDHSPFVDEVTDLSTMAEQLHGAAGQARSAGLELWVEAQHVKRFCYSAERAVALVNRLDPELVGVVFDVSHVVAAGEQPRAYLAALGHRVAHVHVRDAVPGDINVSIGRGNVDFADLIGALNAADFQGHFTLELETHDTAEDRRPEVTAAAAAYISELLGPAFPSSPVFRVAQQASR